MPIRIILAVLILAFPPAFSNAQSVPRARQQQNAACVLDYLKGHAWVRESQGYNAGPGVQQLVAAGGGTYADKPEYCGFTQTAANRSCGLPYPRGGMQGAARAWFPVTGPDARRTLYNRTAHRGTVDSIRVGLKAGYDFGGPTVHHINCVALLGRPARAGRAPRSYWTWGGNEGKGASAGVHYTLWPIGACAALSNWNY